ECFLPQRSAASRLPHCESCISAGSSENCSKDHSSRRRRLQPLPRGGVRVAQGQAPLCLSLGRRRQKAALFTASELVRSRVSYGVSNVGPLPIFACFSVKIHAPLSFSHKAWTTPLIWIFYAPTLFLWCWSSMSLAFSGSGGLVRLIWRLWGCWECCC